jgi:ubiquinone biosynthesis protein UbiJ
VAWIAVGDHWEWFRRVAQARKQRETDPVLPVIERCVTQARDAAARAGAGAEIGVLGDRLSDLLDFVQRFDRGVELFVRGDARAIERVFGALGAIDDEAADRLWRLVGELKPDEMVRAVEAISTLTPSAARRLVALADQPVLRKLVGLT